MLLLKSQEQSLMYTNTAWYYPSQTGHALELILVQPEKGRDYHVGELLSQTSLRTECWQASSQSLAKTSLIVQVQVYLNTDISKLQRWFCLLGRINLRVAIYHSNSQGAFNRVIATYKKTLAGQKLQLIEKIKTLATLN